MQVVAELCNGSTADSDSVCLGSNPSSAVKKNLVLGQGSFLLYSPFDELYWLRPLPQYSPVEIETHLWYN